MNSQNRGQRKYFWQYDGDGNPHRVSKTLALLQCEYLRAMINRQRPLETATESIA
ncbi:hypothetical protein [Leptospira mayottensis]|uniref:hypothetical protein n=1 Tax=Leptospira mayottensis TaxID=1137606 RepID=UPI000301C569|nr:hypothetical protein [Leptospira mayottensis]